MGDWVRAIVGVMLVSLGLAACQSPRELPPPTLSGELTQTPPSTADHSAPSPATGAMGGALALLNGRPVRSVDLDAGMIELAGGQVLVERVLDDALHQRLQSAGFTLADADVTAEKTLLLQSLGDRPEQAPQLLDTLRAQRGLGPSRFATLLWRNAALRRLVRDQVQVTDAAVRQAYDLRYGPRYQGRIIVTATFNEASQAWERARSGGAGEAGGSGESFIDLAIALSQDSSRAQGGLLPPISPADATYPAAIRQALATLEVGAVSNPIALENSYAILKLEKKIAPQSVKFDDVKEGLTQAVRQQQERMLMQRLAREILLQADLTILDPALQAAYRTARDAITAQGTQGAASAEPAPPAAAAP